MSDVRTALQQQVFAKCTHLNHVARLAAQIGDSDSHAPSVAMDGFDGGDPWGTFIEADVLELSWVVNVKREYMGADLLLTCGGPTIHCHLPAGRVEGTWGSECCTAFVSDDTRQALDEYLADLYKVLWP